ncbi:MAG: enolase [Thermoplasmata archaeon]|nr:enolase [Thermoplasmata archaeon]
MTEVREVSLRPIYDSRGALTVEAAVTTAGAALGCAGAPSGASTGTHEVRAWPEGGVPAALQTFRESVRPRLLGREVEDATGWDEALHAIDGTPNFAHLGGNVATALSVAAALARAKERGVEPWSLWARPGVDGRRFPAIVGNCMNGGRHAIGGPEFQEFHAISLAERPEDSVRAAVAVHHAIGKALQGKFPTLALGRGDEGGWVAPITNLEGLEILSAACAQVRDSLHLPVQPGLDLAASEFFRDGRYRYRDRSLDAAGQVAYLTELVDRFGLVYLEDPFAEEEFASFAEFTQAVGSKTVVVGDDLYTTDPIRLARGLTERASNAILIKVNQIGTISDALATVDAARAAGWKTVTSHRSGDLPDGWLAQLAVATGAYGLKCGILGGERVAKLNELLRLGALPT